MEASNEAVLEYLRTERVASPETTSAWVIQGYALATHPDLCDRVNEVNAAADDATTLEYRYGRPVLIAANGMIVAFATGTYVFCLRLPRSEVDPRLLEDRKDNLSEYPLLRRKQEQLDALAAAAWTRVQPWPVDVPRAEGLQLLAELLRKAAIAVTSSLPPAG